MASYIATSSAYHYDATSVSPGAPAGLADDDLMLAIAGCINGISSAPAGWTQLGGNSAETFTLWRKIASGESGTYQFSQASTGKIRVQIAAWSGINIYNPISVVSDTEYTASDTTLRAASMIVPDAGSTLIFAGGFYRELSSSSTPPTNPDTFTERVDAGETSSDFWCCFSDLEWSGSGATGNMDATMSNALASKHAMAIALNDMGGGGRQASHIGF